MNKNALFWGGNQVFFSIRSKGRKAKKKHNKKTKIRRV